MITANTGGCSEAIGRNYSAYQTDFTFMLPAQGKVWSLNQWPKQCALAIEVATRLLLRRAAGFGQGHRKTSDGEEDAAPALRGSSSFWYLCHTPTKQIGRDLSSGKKRREVRSRAKVWVAQMLRESSPSPVSSLTHPIGSEPRTLPSTKISAMPLSVFTLAEDFNLAEWTTVS